MLLNGIYDVTCEYNGEKLEFIGKVPGCVHRDLIENGTIKDIFYRDNSEKYEWIENADFTYSRTFSVSELKPCAYISFDGIDTYSKIYLNGVLIGETDDMFIPYSFRVDGILKEGENRLRVELRSPIKEVRGLPLREGAFTRERMNTRRIQCTYGWDWVARFVTLGIIGDVSLDFREHNEIDNVYIYTKDINPYSAQLQLDISIRDFRDSGESLKILITSPDGQAVIEKERRLISPMLSERIDITSPELWYPNGYGAQPLYTLTVISGNDEKRLNFGIRRISVIQPPDAPESENKKIAMMLKSVDYLAARDRNEVTSGFTILVNDIPIFAKGADFVPCEPFISDETPEKVTRLLTLAKEAHINMIRVWGGGVFSSDIFYDTCDRLGILVAQDFLMACGHYPEDEEWFIDRLNKEAYHAAIRLRNHPSLAFWNGDNENAVDGDENRTDYPGFLSATRGIEPILKKYDPERYFFASSPYGGFPFSSVTVGTAHNTNYVFDYMTFIKNNGMKDYIEERGEHLLSRFNSEQPIFGLPFVSSLKKFMTDEDIFGADQSISEYHTKNNPALGDTTLYDYFIIFTKKVFGDFQDGADRVKKCQMIQCDTVRMTMELYRRNKSFASGLLYWMYNDCWPSANGWSIVDYYAMPKPAYYAFKRAAKPVIASVWKKWGIYSVYVCNDGLKNARGRGVLYSYNIKSGNSDSIFKFEFDVAGSSSSAVFTVTADAFKISADNILICDIEGEFGSDRAMYISGRYSDFDFEYSEPRIIAEDSESITVISDTFNPIALIDVPYLIEENAFIAKRGEIRKIPKVRS